WANSVAILGDGGFVTTKFMADPGEGIEKIIAGEVNGEVYEWRPGGEVQAIPGTELSGANGIELSPDDRFLYVAAFGGREVVRYDRSASPPSKTSVSVDINPDNLRWTPDGDLLTVGSDLASGTGGWTIYRIDAEAMDATAVGGADGSAALQGASAALEVDGEIWIGTYNGDRVGVMPSRGPNAPSRARTIARRTAPRPHPSPERDEPTGIETRPWRKPRPRIACAVDFQRLTTNVAFGMVLAERARIVRGEPACARSKTPSDSSSADLRSRSSSSRSSRSA